jgi:hypothetical protein
VNPLEAVQALGVSLYFVMTIVVGVRLLVLARINRGVPELFLGLGYLLGGTIGSCLEVGGMVSAQLEAPPARVATLFLTGKAFGVVGLACSYSFIWWVFRRDERGALLLMSAAIAAAVVAFAGLISSGTASSGVSPAPWFWIEFVARLGHPCWLGLEAGRYYFQMKRRMRLGLADAVVVNRFLLWTFAAGFGILMGFTAIPPALLGRTHALSHAGLVAFSLVGVGAAVCYWLAFFPPEAYRRRIYARAVAEA